MVASSRVKNRASVEIDSVARNAAALCTGGRRERFFEIYKLCRNNPHLLSRGIQLAQRKYLSNHNPTHVLKSLVFFDDAERDPIFPFSDVAWDEVTEYFRAEVPRIAKKILHLEEVSERRGQS